jgi:cell division transport system permease protein
MRIGFFLREAVRATRRSAAPSFAALATVLVTLLVLGVFIPIVQATNGAANSVRSRVEVDVYMKTNATAADNARVRQELLNVPHVKSVQFVSKQAAYAQQAKIDPAAYKLLGSNPLPDTFHVIPDNPGNVLAVHNSLAPPTAGGNSASTQSTIDQSISTVSNKRNDTKKILEVTNLVTITAAVLTVLLTIASVLLIANTIRLSLYARRREVEVMKLVGATDWFIRWPFVIEGIVVGAAGALLAVAVLGVTKVALLDPLANNWTLIAAPRTISFTALLIVLLGAGIGVSALGSGLSLRRFLRV